MQLEITDFGIDPKKFHHDLLQNNKPKERQQQLEITHFPLKKFTCPVSKIVFENIYDHNRKCIYKYCRNGWEFAKEYD